MLQAKHNGNRLAMLQQRSPWLGVLSTALTAGCWVVLTAQPGTAQIAPTQAPPSAAKVQTKIQSSSQAAPVQAAQAPTAQVETAPNSNPVIKVGIVQRFADEPTDQITLQPMSGDRLSLRFKTNGQDQTVTTTGTVKVDVVVEPLPAPQVTERVVLSTHRSFESAEDSANQWRSQGVEVEVAQPRQWQVWAKRNTYRTPLLRRLLLKNLQAQGSRTAFIDSQVQRQIAKASFVVNGYRYTRDELEVVAGNSRVYVNESNQQSDRRLFGGSLRLQPNAYGTYTLVNFVPTETYLRGVVPHEIGLGAPPNTIQAQAILARTYALRNLRRFAIDGYQLCADTQCQVYRGLSGAASESDQAILATRGLVLTYGNELIDALYSSTTGGVTAPFSDVWNGPDRPYLKAVVDSVQNVWDLSSRPLSDERNLRDFISLRQGFNEADWDTFRWRGESTLAQIADDLRKYLQSKQSPLANLTRVEQMQIVERSPAGRVQKVQIQTDRGTVTLEKDEVLRALYAPKSLLFYIDPIYEEAPPQLPALPSADNAPSAGSSPFVEASPNVAGSPTPLPFPAEQPRVLKGYAFVGGGLGHAVGMSQTGAYNLGRLNWSASRILSFYYPGTQLETLNNTILLWRDPS